MAKKFFYNRVYNTKRTIINLVIIGVCIIGIIICFIITSNFQGNNIETPERVLNIKKEVTVEINQEYSNEIFFSKIENVDIDKIKISYDKNFDISKPGRYKATLRINNKDYNSTLLVVDTIKPKLTLKEVIINENDTYTPKDFVTSCTDNSNKECNIYFYTDGIDAEGNKTDYSRFTASGIYVIKIAAKDSSDNITVKETKLIINKKSGSSIITPIPTTPDTCKYGNDKYDTNNYLVAIFVTSNHCAVSLNLYKDASMTSEINKLMESESIKIQKDVDALNLKGTFALNRKVTAIVNTTGDGIVGYELKITVTVTNNNVVDTIAEYKIDSDGKRVFTTNPYKLN